MHISQFFLLSPRGDCIISKDFRNDIATEKRDVFFKNVKFFKGKEQEAPPVFNINGVNYFYTKSNGLYFVCTTRKNKMRRRRQAVARGHTRL